MHDLEESLRDVVVRSISSLAAVCDHAQTIDGMGFSKSTAGPGHEIAAIGSNQWTPDFWDYAARLASHHSRQLEKSGQMDLMDGERLREALRDPSVAAPEIPTHWIDLADVDGRRMVVLSMPSDERLPKILKNLPEEDVYRPAGVGRLWRVSTRWAFAAEAFLDQFTRVGEGVREAVAASDRLASAEDRMLATDLPLVRYDAGKDEFTFKFSYDRDFGADLKKHGGRFEKGASWKDCTAFVPANRFGAAVVDRCLAGEPGAVLHTEAVLPLDEARRKEPSAKTLAAGAAPRLLFEEPSDGRLRVKMTRFVPEFVQAIKSVPGRAYDNGSWLIPASAEAAELLASRLDALESPEAMAAALELRALAEAFGAGHSPAAATELSIEDAGDKFVTLTMSHYVAEWVNSIKDLPKGDRRYDADSKAWKVRKDSDTFSELLERLQAACASLGSPAYFEVAIANVERVLGDIRAADGPGGMRM